MSPYNNNKRFDSPSPSIIILLESYNVIDLVTSGILKEKKY
jgi:hypothetical protein